MSPPHGRPKEGSVPPGGKARSAKGALMSPPHGRPKEGSLPPGGKARSAKGALMTPPHGRPKEGSGSPWSWRLPPCCSCRSCCPPSA